MIRLFVSLGIVSAVALTGCAGSSSDSTSSPSPAATTGLLPPVIVDENATEAKANVGDVIVFNVNNPADSKVSVDDPKVLEITQGYSDGSAEFNPGAVAVSKGTATVTIESDGSTRNVVVTVD